MKTARQLRDELFFTFKRTSFLQCVDNQQVVLNVNLMGKTIRREVSDYMEAVAEPHFL